MGGASAFPLVGREEALDALARELAGAPGRGGMVLVAGEPGIGKTRLLTEFASRSADAGDVVLFGRCQPDPAYPYEPFVDALSPEQVITQLGELPSATRRHLSTLLPQLERDARGSGTMDVELERLHLFDAVAEALVALGGSRPAVLLLDDLHWAEASTLALLTHLHGRGDTHGALIVGSLRDPDPDLGTALPAELERLRRLHPVGRVEIGGLDDAGAAEVIGRWAEQEPPQRLVAELRALTEGNPFFLRSVLEQLRGEGALFGPDGRLADRLAAPEGLSPDVVKTIELRVAALGAEAQALLAAGALIGREFAISEAIEAAGLDAAGAVDAADAATRAGLVHQLDGTAIRLRFDHALVQQALVRALSPSRRSLFHLRIGESIERAGQAEGRVGELALHFGSALSFGAAPKALTYARRAAETAARQYAFDEAAANLELALRALGAVGDDGWEDRYELLMERGLVQHRAGAPAPSGDTFREAADLAHAHGDAARLARAAVGAGLERFLFRFGEADPVHVELLARALEGADGALRSRLISMLAHERCLLEPVGERIAKIDGAVALARAVDDPTALVDALTVRQIVAWTPARTVELLADSPAVAALADDLGRLDVVMHLHCTAVGYAFELNRREELDEQLAAAGRVAATLRVPIQQMRISTLGIALTLVEGRLDDARRAMATLVPAIAEIEPLMAAHVTAIWQFLLAREGGDVDAVREGLRGAVESAPGVPVVRAMLAELCAHSGDLAGAAEHLTVLGRDDFAGIHEDFMWLGVLTMAAAAAAAIGARPSAERLYDLLAPWEDRNALLGAAAVNRPVAHVLGLLAKSLGRDNAALEHFRRTAGQARAIGALPWEAHALYEQGALLRAAGQTQEARGALRAALDLSDRYGGRWLADHVRAELRAAGGRPRRDRLDGPEALTTAELRVARLAAGGLTNAEIGETLVLAQRTVETHLTHAYRKLGASRADLAEKLNGAGP